MKPMKAKATPKRVRNALRGYLGWKYKLWRGEVDRSYMALLRQSRLWNRQTLKAWQWGCLKKLLDHAWKTVPAYRERFQRSGLHPEEIKTAEDFRKLPTLSRDELRALGPRLLSADYRKEDLVLRRSGGSTGEPVAVYLEPRRRRLATTEEIWADRWSGWKPGEPVARIWSTHGRPAGAWLRRWFRSHVLDPGFIIDACQLAEPSLKAFVRRYMAHRPGLVVGYASSLRMLGEFLVSKDIHLPPPHAVISSAELLDEHTRAVLNRTFRCPVVDRYGCREAGLIACQCRPDGRYHVNTCRIYLEILDEHDQPAEEGKGGRVIVTDLGNLAMPLIRYELGDRAAWAIGRKCPCGSAAECLDHLEGRTTDFVWSAAGYPIHRAWFNSLLLSIPGLRQYHLVQESTGSVMIEIVESSPVPADRLREACSWIRQAISGEVSVRVARRERLQQTPSGKYRYVESRLPAPPTRTLDTSP